ncbi:hypothetical protein C7446_2043 [Kushneria sinocarnis]|uniref:Uncharacterized protein n=1 Tax=Kushneria sinocarnis TaxID=595502 RepID=A0A420WWL0_9GAMM|nr:hypothetical protein C7446_2043 [Kushneria sinocarnis]
MKARLIIALLVLAAVAAIRCTLRCRRMSFARRLQSRGC